eukprot:TRINITY_DN31725_c0_g1_i1.p1 TRINITY_DN31725_c0_g1~~TRINITY_DN31725_c0_g1_i1.p1  ORF type:complete len:317 (-),score=24.67 TRINITY_DN31725_c0_g1_i1:38-916(-)
MMFRPMLTSMLLMRLWSVCSSEVLSGNACADGSCADEVSEEGDLVAVSMLQKHANGGVSSKVQQGERRMKGKHNTSLNTCTASYGAVIGSPNCCGQEGTVDSEEYVCPEDEPLCKDFVNGRQFGTCARVTCTADYGSKIGDANCCGEGGTVDSLDFVCFETRPLCTGFKNGKAFGKCTGIPCTADYGSKIGGKNCCGEGGTVEDGKYVCPLSFPLCDGFKNGRAFGTCKAAGPPQECTADYGSVVGDKNCCGQGGSLSEERNACPAHAPFCKGFIDRRIMGKCAPAGPGNVV